MNTFAKQLRFLREQRGISLNSMAKNLGVSSGYLSNLENGKTENLSISFLNQVIGFLNLSSCPVCHQKIEEKLAHLDNEHMVRINRICQSLILLAVEDPIAFSFQIKLLELGLLAPSAKNIKLYSNDRIGDDLRQ